MGDISLVASQAGADAFPVARSKLEEVVGTRVFGASAGSLRNSTERG